MLLVDGALTYLSWLAVLKLRFGPETSDVFFNQLGWLKLLLAAAIVQASFYLCDLYDLQSIRARAELAIRIVQAIGLSAIALAVISYGLPRLALGRGVWLMNLPLMLTLMTAWRIVAHWLLAHPRLAERVLILGTGERAIELARTTLSRRSAGYDVTGFVGDDPSLVGRSLINPRVVGLVGDLEGLVARYQTSRIVVALEERRGRVPLDLLLTLKVRDAVAIEDATGFYERLTGKINLEQLRPSQLVFADGARWMRFYKRARRIADILLSITGLILSAPLMIAAAIAIRLESAGPALYRQERVGLYGERFRIIKFRSMRIDAERNGPVWAGVADPRVTRVGRIIRRLRIDELPQFINIIRGEMSLIGPRPERPVFVEQLEGLIPFYAQRHLVRPGLTGWAQVRYPYGASLEDAREKHQYDLYYIKNQSPMLDAIILLETLRIVLFGKLSR